MQPDVSRSFEWQRQFIPEVKAIIGRHLISEAPPEEDNERNTDLIVLRLDAIRVACRIRDHTYARNYAHEFTIRSSRPSGTKTELGKIIEGWGDYLFYGFAHDQAGLIAWTLGDLRVFRLWLWRERERRGRLPGTEQTNHDGSSKFYAYRTLDLPDDFVVAQLEALVVT